MGELIFTPIQKSVFDAFAKNEGLRRQFYFTGGTALSVFYLQHRYSEDMDFFSLKPFNDEEVLAFINHLSQQLGLSYIVNKQTLVTTFQFSKEGELLLKIDFGHYPYPLVDKGKIVNDVQIDSLRDIATNKLLTIILRQNAKDFVDLYFLLQKDFSVWDLIYGLEAKFRMETDILYLASDFLKSQKFEVLPKMIKPLELGELKDFFKKQAIDLGWKVTE